jgi:hypothetical protein
MPDVIDFKQRIRDRDGILRFVTMDPHEINADGSALTDHCCGCWNVFFDPREPFRLTAECNECGDQRIVTVPGIGDN